MMKLVSGCLLSFFCSVHLLTAQTPEDLKNWLPQVDGWEIAANAEVFDADNLFNRINGAAPLYLENNFREMTSLEYTKSDNYITIQAYRHASPIDAFGIYATERSPGATFFPIGGEAHGNETSMCFFAGNLYVKMWGSTTENILDVLQVIARQLAGETDPDATLPPVFQLFPQKDKIAHSEAYIASSYIGHEFLDQVSTVQYQKDNARFQAFIIERDQAASARELLVKYFTFTGQPLDFQEGYLTITDKYNGDIPVIWKGRYIAGIFSENGNVMPDASGFLEEIAGALE